MSENKINKTTMIIDALKLEHPDVYIRGIYDRVNPEISLEGCMATFWVLGFKSFVSHCCGDDQFTKNEVLSLLTRVYDESEDFMTAIAEGEMPKKSRHLKADTKVVDALSHFFSWDGYVSEAIDKISSDLTLADIIKNHDEGKGINYKIEIGDSEVENYICWCASVVVGRWIDRYPEKPFEPEEKQTITLKKKGRSR